MKDNRKLERFRLAVESVCIMNDEKGNEKKVAAFTRDISASGAFLITDGQEIPVGAPVRLEMTLGLEKMSGVLKKNDHVTLHADGLVTRSNKEGMAVAFATRLRFSAE